MTKADIAKKYASLGWPVFPLHSITDSGRCSCRENCPSPGKHPRTVHGVKQATTDPLVINNWFQSWPDANIGIATGKASGLVVFDFDFKDDGMSFLQTLERPDTLEQQTGSGATQYFFKYPSEGSIRNRTKVNGIGMDIRGDGGYIVAPPSNHKSGQLYEWIDCELPDLEDLADIPEDWLEFAKPRDELPEGVGQRLGVSTLNQDEIEKVRSALQYIKPTGDDWLHIGFALHEATDGALWAFELWDAWAQTSPAHYLDDAQAHYKRWISFKDQRADNITLSTVYHKAQRNGWKWVPPVADLDHFPDLRGEVAKVAEQFPNQFARPVLEYLEISDETRKAGEIWGGHLLFSGGLLLIAGEPKIGKSLVFQEFAIQAALGGEFLGQKFTRSIKVLWFQAEIHENYLSKRLHPILSRYDIPSQKIISANFFATGKHSLDVQNDSDYRFMQKQIIEIAPDLVCFDPMINYTTANEIDNTAMSASLDRFVKLAEVGNCSLVLIHHVGKGAKRQLANGGDPFDLIRGASAIRGRYDTGIMMFKNKHKEIECQYDTRNGKPPLAHALELKHDTGEVIKTALTVQPKEDGTYSALAKTVTTLTPEKKVAMCSLIDEINKAPGGELLAKYCNDHIQKHLDIGDRAARQFLSELTHEGVIRKIGTSGPSVRYKVNDAELAQEKAL